MQRNFRATAKPPEPKDDLLIMKKTREMIAYGHDCLYNKQFPRNQRIGNAIGAQIGMRSRIKYIVKAYERGEMTLQEVNTTMQSYFGLIKHCTNEGLRENIINGFVLHCTDAARAKARESR